MSGWRALERELDAWAAAGREATFWWRDDDAAEAAPALVRLLELAAGRAVPLCLAIVPDRATPEAVALVAGYPDIAVAVHGFAHANRAREGDRKAEFAEGRPMAAMLDELGRARARLAELAGARARAVLVPPWNRLAPALVPRLPEVGFTGLSTYLARPAAMAAPGLGQVNTHVDIVDWRGGRGFVGTGAALKLVIDHLADRRLGRADAQEPTGLLGHHLVHDDDAWDFIAAFIDATAKHEAARWLDLDTAFGETP